MNKDYTKSSGNIFADLGFPNPEQELLKAKLTLQVHKLLKDMDITQKEAAELLDTTQPRISELMRCRPVSVSVERLMGFLTKLGQDIEVNVKPASIKNAGHQGQVFVNVPNELRP